MATETYALLDSGNGRKLERFGRYVLVRLKKAKEDNAWLLLKGKE